MNLDTGMFGSLALALGIGLLIGIDRERRKGRGPTRHFAGIRTFSLVALAGAATQLLGQPWLAAVGAALVAGLAVVSHLKDRSSDPGATTEIALFVTFLLGMFAVAQPALGAALGVVVAGLLAARVPLQRFSTQVLSEQELRDALVLTGAALIILPLAPNAPLPWLAGVNPYAVWLLVVVIMSVQALGHVAIRLLGARIGLPLSGLFSGFVSSTVTIAAMGGRAARQPERFRACVAGGWLSTVATVLQLLLIALALYPPAVALLAPSLGAALLVALASGALSLWRERGLRDETRLSGRAFDLRQSLGWAALLGGLAALVGWLQDHVGPRATVAAAALAGLADTHSTAAAVIGLLPQGRIEPATVWLSVLLAFSSNTVSKIVAAYVAGGPRFGRAMSGGLLLVAVAAWLPWLWQRLAG